MYSKLQKCDYGSEFSNSESEAERTGGSSTASKYDRSLMESMNPTRMGALRSSGPSAMHKIPSKRTFDAELDRQEGKRMRHHGILAMDAFARHQKMVNDYLIYYGGKREDFKESHTSITEKEIIKQNNKFLWEDQGDKLSWEQQLAFKYWNKLYKEYTIADLSHFKENKIALRWRIEKEVVSGKGQFICGNKKCEETDGLRSWEVNFSYVENGDKRNALVKLRLCPECSYKLNYRKRRREIKQKRHKKTSKQKNEDTDVTGISEHQSPSSSAASSAIAKETDEQNTWTRPVQEDLSREDEFDKYFDDMFL